jgi:L-ascorbate metabolism protein UlaG (beta-lactamase superfamily)
MLLNNLRLIVLAFLCAGCANSEIRSASLQTVEPLDQTAALSVVFLGTTSFLIETSTEQLLLDGYISRSRHMLVFPIQPSSERLDAMLHDLSICKSKGANNLKGQNANCQAPDQPRLALALAMHGHYDHVMDLSYIAGWAGAPMLSDPSIDPLWSETRELTKRRPEAFNWTQAEGARLPMKNYLEPHAKAMPLKSLNIRLFETEHNDNLISGWIKPATPGHFRFPSLIWNMGLGRNLSVLVQHEEQNMLFIGSAGKIGSVFSDANVKADVVFLSIGGVSVRPENEWDEYWSNVVLATEAKRVFLTHWDNHQKPLTAPDHRLKPTIFENHDAVYAHFRMLAARDGVLLLFAPVAQRFDPFRGSGPL